MARVCCNRLLDASSRNHTLRDEPHSGLGLSVMESRVGDMPYWVRVTRTFAASHSPVQGNPIHILTPPNSPSLGNAPDTFRSACPSVPSPKRTMFPFALESLMA